MKCYEVYLESSSEGLCMAHVAGLPGCIVRGQSCEEALAHLPGAIAAHHVWLARHGEQLAGSGPEGDEQIELRVKAESRGLGPFEAGDAAALFPPDREPVGMDELEGFLRLSAHARVDLLALVRLVPAELLAWQPYPDWYSIEGVLRHVGNAEEWYVSRLVPPETLPSEWANDEDLPLFEFLEMERRTAFARLRQLTPQECGGIFKPSIWTRHPEEAWTLRKVLRRFLEHELEHTAQIRHILDLYRSGLVASLAARQTALLEPLLGLPAEALAERSVAGGGTVKDRLAWTLVRGQRQIEALEATTGGEQRGAVVVLEDAVGRGDDEAALVASWRERGLGEVLAALDALQASWLARLAAVPEEALFRRGPSAGTAEAVAGWSRQLEEGADQLAAWRVGAARLGAEAPIAEVLRATLLAGRRELLSAVSLILAGDPSRCVCGTWSLHDVVGHVADWELLGVEGLRHMAAGSAAGPLPMEPIADIDAWNESHAAARRDQPWEEVWAILVEARQALLDTLEGMGEPALARKFAFPWGGQGTPYEWLRAYLAHDREHAAGLRAALVVPATYSCS